MLKGHEALGPSAAEPQHPNLESVEKNPATIESDT